jgi:hypothetical protein
MPGTKETEEHWIRAYWRPAMGWLYMVICFVDFVLFPLMVMFIPVILRNMAGIEDVSYVPWTSITLVNGGLIHLSFGAILGAAAWTRGMEKIACIKEDMHDEMRGDHRGRR